MTEELLRIILRRFAHPDLKDPSCSFHPGAALRAADSGSEAHLMNVVCDVWGVPFGVLADRSGVENSILAACVIGRVPLNSTEKKAIVKALKEITAEKVRGG